MKSQVDAILHVLLGLCEDIRVTYPALRGLDRDISRLTLLVKSRGLGFLGLDLPVLDDILLDGLENGRLKSTLHPFRAVSKTTRVPRFLSGLWLRIFDRDACLRPDVDPTAIAFLRQFTLMAKRALATCSVKRQKAAIRNYENVEACQENPSLHWESDSQDTWRQASVTTLVDKSLRGLPLFPEEKTTDTRTLHLLAKCQFVADLVVNKMDSFCPEIWAELNTDLDGVPGFRHGPGAVSEGLKGHQKSDFDNWPLKLESTFPFAQFGKMPNDVREPSRKERPSRLVMVAKTLKGPRLIAAEPVAHQWCQQSVLSYLLHEFHRLFNRWFIDLKDQGKSAKMVHQASLNRKLATVDLSDASDRLSCAVVERMLRRNPTLLNALAAARTRYVKIDHLGKTSYLKLRKFATQGTAVTFPVQSLIFLIIAITSSIRGPITWDAVMRLKKTVRVYGDDIIIPVHGYEDLKLLMDALGLKVNDKKSFARGFFRESCGSDEYQGYDVTPCKPECFSPGDPSGIIAVTDASNNLFKKGFWNASERLYSLIPDYAKRRHRIVGPDSSGFSGRFSFVGNDERHLRTRWNSRYHRVEVRVFGSYQTSERLPRSGFGALVDFATKRYCAGSPRIVSEYARIRNTKGGVRWEPSAIGVRGLSCLLSLRQHYHAGHYVSENSERVSRTCVAQRETRCWSE